MLALPGCADKAPDARAVSGFASVEDEIAIGRAERHTILAQFGGEAGAPELRRYVSALGALIARAVERTDLPYSFTVLNSPVVNAFATPGGFVYVTRGLVELADSEAELAAALAHELGHQAALHHARRDGRIVRTSILLAGLGAARGTDMLGQVLAAGALQAFSPEGEREADALAIRYLARTGHDVGALARVLGKLRAEARLQAELRGEPPDAVNPFGYLATHPAPPERVARATDLADKVEQNGGETARDVYLDKIDGLAYGDDPGRGVIEGRVFASPVERIRFEAPPGFHMFAMAGVVTAFGPKGARLLFDTARGDRDLPARRYLAEVWAPDADLQTASIDIGGLEAATAIARGRTDAGPADVRLVAIHAGPGLYYRFVFATPMAATRALATELRRTTYSFRRLTEAEARALKPRTLRVVTVAPADTVDSLAARMPFTDHRRERFEVLNGLSPGARIAAGMRVKTVE